MAKGEHRDEANMGSYRADMGKKQSASLPNCLALSSQRPHRIYRKELQKADSAHSIPLECRIIAELPPHLIKHLQVTENNRRNAAAAPSKSTEQQGKPGATQKSKITGFLNQDLTKQVC